ncbi:DUF2746 domain-containing protein [Streptomyces sp. NPDC015127]|uniref:DUF2746 domain-containing protein n=1 Tax=Streptomyces sp. NPDC015127 TaxID=3364939 RepID=UPI0036FF5870
MTALAMEPGVQVALVTAGGTVVVAVIGVFAELLRRQTATLSEVRDQVSNTHDTNLRDDLDSVMHRLDRVIDNQTRQNEALERHGRDLTSLREEIAHERRERLSVEERLDDHIVSAAA